MRKLFLLTLIGCVLIAVGASAAEPAGPESKRLARAKDYIFEEQWTKAVDELRGAVADPKETRKDEVLYWLAHSLNQSNDRAAAVETISRLERDHPSSIWVKPARALKLEIAVHLNRSDVLFYAAMPPPPPPIPIPMMKDPAQPGPAKVVTPKVLTPKVEPSKGDGPKKIDGPAKIPPPLPPKLWYTEAYNRDGDLRIQALNALLKSDADVAIPLLTDIAFESPDPGQVNRAVFVLAQSDLPRAIEMVVKVAKSGPEPAQLAAVKALGRWGGPKVSLDLMQVYDTAGEQLKFQIVRSFGERADTSALQRIVQSEKDAKIRYVAVEGLGQAGAVNQLWLMYKTAPVPLRRAIIDGLFNARADATLMLVADVERNKGGDPQLEREALERLRLLATPKAKEYLLKVGEKR